MAKIEVQDVSYCYGERGRCFRALDHVSCTIAPGEFVCLVGRSGCGKSTLLRLLSGLAAPTEGRILLNGAPLRGPGTDRAVVFQDDPLFPWMTARKNVQFAIRQAHPGMSRAAAAERAMAFLRRVEMEEAAGRYPCELSGGMRQRVAIARAMAMDAEVLLLDEPFAALDPRIRRELQALLERLWQSGEAGRKSVLFVTHDIREAVLLADRVLFMEPGQIAAERAVALPRPRFALAGADKDALESLRGELTRLFYRSGGGEDEA